MNGTSRNKNSLLAASSPHAPWKLALKRLFDLILALFLLFPLLPVMILEALAITLESGRPFLFIQERVGEGGRAFRMFKFRTMLPEKLIGGQPVHVPDSERITPLGNFLRKSSLDELPQLFNILIGNMSFVGPRPTLRYQVDRYTPFQLRRLEVKPGITGWAQVNGRNNLGWEEKIKLDVDYVNAFSLWIDLKIIFMTFGVLLKHGDIEFKKDDNISRLD